jgi:hypothetical protein
MGKGPQNDVDNVEEQDDVDEESTDDDAETDDDGGDEKEDKPLGRAGEQALEREKDKRRKAAGALRPWTALARELGVTTPEQLKALLAKKNGDDRDADADKTRREADAAATARANARIVRSEVKAAAAGKLADPADAVRLLDLTQFEVDQDGEIDEDAVAEAIDDLVKKKPYLAAAAKKQKQTKDPSQGARPNAKKSASERAQARLQRMGLAPTKST